MEKHVLLIDEDADELEFFSMVTPHLPAKIRCTHLEPDKFLPDTMIDLNPDIVLIEPHIGTIDSFDCVKTVKALHPDLPFVFYTSFISEKVVAKAGECGAAACLQKPTDLRGFREMFQKLLQILQK